MKHLLLLITYLCITFVLHAQGIKTINISAGGLSSAINSTERYNITHLTITGTIDARDFRIMRDSMQNLSVIDLSGSRIISYFSSKNRIRLDGTNISRITDWNTGSDIESLSFNCDEGYNFAIDEVPIFAFRNNGNFESIISPSSATAISYRAFMACSKLISFTIPEKITLIENEAFSECSSLKTIIVRSAIPVDLSKNADVFEGVPKNSCTLFVPVGSKGKYELAAGWKDFKNIVELE